jgi:ribosome-binding factor A
MSNRTVRVNELIQRELSDILRKRYQTEAVAITISGVQVSPDLRDGRVYIAVTGSPELAEDRMRWIRKKSQEIRFELGRRIVLKYMPQFTYALDESTARGNRILEVLDGLGVTPPTEEEDEEANK